MREAVSVAMGAQSSCGAAKTTDAHVLMTAAVQQQRQEGYIKGGQKQKPGWAQRSLYACGV